ncbi:unnamed protein product [Camellia sinensis]
MLECVPHRLELPYLCWKSYTPGFSMLQHRMMGSILEKQDLVLQ